MAVGTIFLVWTTLVAMFYLLRPEGGDGRRLYKAAASVSPFSAREIPITIGLVPVRRTSFKWNSYGLLDLRNEMKPVFYGKNKVVELPPMDGGNWSIKWFANTTMFGIGMRGRTFDRKNQGFTVSRMMQDQLPARFRYRPPWRRRRVGLWRWVDEDL